MSLKTVSGFLIGECFKYWGLAISSVFKCVSPGLLLGGGFCVWGVNKVAW